MNRSGMGALGVIRMGLGRAALALVSCAILFGMVNGAAARGFWQQPATIDFRQPERQYEGVKLVDAKYGEVTVSVEKQLKAEAPAVSKRALARLKTMRAKALEAAPKHARERLAKVPYFLMYGPKARNGGKPSGLDYIQKNGPEHHPELDPRWGDAIVIYCAKNYLDITDLWALKALFHELGHAYQLEQWPEKQPDILAAWEHARDNNLYLNVRDVETGKRLPEAYALTNQLEFFAELSCMYFVRCNYEPSNQKQLKAYDPVGYAMIRKMWKVE